jgi:hypothetical protein
MLYGLRFSRSAQFGMQGQDSSAVLQKHLRQDSSLTVSAKGVLQGLFVVLLLVSAVGYQASGKVSESDALSVIGALNLGQQGQHREQDRLFKIGLRKASTLR